MSKFQEEFDKRLRRVCGITDDTKRVRYDEYLDGGYQTCYNCDPGSYGSFDYGPSYKIEVSVFYEKGTYQVITVAQRTFDGMADLMRALDEVKV